MSELEQAGFYLKYVGLLVDDTVHLLDGALEKVPALREEEAAQARQAEWLAIPVEERREREQNFQRDQSVRGGRGQGAGIGSDGDRDSY